MKNGLIEAGESVADVPGVIEREMRSAFGVYICKLPRGHPVPLFGGERRKRRKPRTKAHRTQFPARASGKYRGEQFTT